MISGFFSQQCCSRYPFFDGGKSGSNLLWFPSSIAGGAAEDFLPRWSGIWDPGSVALAHSVPSKFREVINVVFLLDPVIAFQTLFLHLQQIKEQDWHAILKEQSERCVPNCVPPLLLVQLLSDFGSIIAYWMKLTQNKGHMELIYEWFKFRMDPFKACFPQPEGEFHIIWLFCWDTW